MSLTGKQKKYLKKNYKHQSIEQIASALGLSESEINDYVKKRWGKTKVLVNTPQTDINESGLKEKVIAFNFKNWLITNRFPLLILALLVIIAYFNSLNNAFVSDDVAGILKNENLNNFSQVFVTPQNVIRNFFYVLINKTFGKTPIFFRLINIFFHLGVVLTVYLLADLFINQEAAFFTASLTAVHPFLTEAVTWISGGPYSQYAFFIFLSFLFFIFSLFKGRKFFAISLLFFFFSLLSSEKAMILPLIIFVFIFSFSKLKANWGKILIFLLIGGSYTLYFIAKITSRISSLKTDFYQKPQIMNPLYQIPVAIISYLQLIFWPQGLTLYHTEIRLSSGQYFVYFIIFIAFIVSIVYSFKRFRPVFFWLIFFFISLLPTMTPFGISWLVAERYCYLGAVGILMVIALILNRFNLVKKTNLVLTGVFIALILILTSMTIIRNIDWKNEDNLWLAAAKTSPSSPQNHNNLGDYYSRHGNFEQAAKEFQTAIMFQPNYADAFHNLANVYSQLKQYDKAVENYRKAIKFNSRLWQSHQNLGAIYFGQGKFPEAEKEFQKAISLSPGNVSLYNGLSTIYLKQKKMALAKETLEKALSLEPNNQNIKQLLNSLR